MSQKQKHRSTQTETVACKRHCALSYQLFPRPHTTIITTQSPSPNYLLGNGAALHIELGQSIRVHEKTEY
ncbi:hypothetical protein NECAME_02775 [Necator americanus]|uniref:Uncharacterized protein n=1 Tax=Necator americanus TaxID=51031 RepID=W2TCJ6_NECAM|nr:hypothetical protein NECAME_02775 [Necator americanus]ETN78911.1 hypothetical protein NECAME_02775 [Necator americanus]